MKFSEFYRKFSDERECVALLKSITQPEVHHCKKCKSNDIYWIDKLKGWRCKNCRFRMTLKSLTFMRDSNLSYVEWLELIFLCLYGKKSMSVNEITRVSRQNRYDTVAYAIKKIRQLLVFKNENLSTDFLAKIDLLNVEKEKKSSSIDYPNIPATIYVHITKSKRKGEDKIHFSLNNKDKLNFQNIVKSRSNLRSKIIPNLNMFKGVELVKITPLWEKKLRENFIKTIKGSYHNISLLYIKGMLAEYAFKYNNRKESKENLFLFLEMIIT